MRTLERAIAYGAGRQRTTLTACMPCGSKGSESARTLSVSSIFNLVNKDLVITDAEAKST